VSKKSAFEIPLHFGQINAPKKKKGRNRLNLKHKIAFKWTAIEGAFFWGWESATIYHLNS